MSHLMTVQGLLCFLGGPPNFMREDPPFDSDFYPFPFQLLPISRQSLAYYVAAECPDFASLPKDVTDLLPQTMGQIRINRVGILYAKLISIFTERPKPDDKELHLEDTDFLTNVGSYQPPKDDWSKNIDNPTLPDPLPSPMTGKQIRARGLQVLRAIKEQGESGSDANSHFERYLAIFTAFPKGPGPADDVATNPNTSLPRTPRDPTESELAKGRITNKVSRLWAQFFNARYRLLLMRLSHFLVLEDSTDMGKKDRRAFLQTTCLSEMPNHLGPLATQLVTLPLTDHPACKSKAGAPFELPYTLNIPDREPDRWRLHRDVVVLSTNVYNALVQKDPSLVNDPLVKDIHRSDLDDLTFIEQAINATS